jgi:putative transposase
MCCSSLNSAAAALTWPARTAHADDAWITPACRVRTRAEPVRFLIRDRDRKFTSRFDAMFEAPTVRIGRTPIPAPEANGIAERFVRTVRSEYLDWLSMVNARS